MNAAILFLMLFAPVERTHVAGDVWHWATRLGDVGLHRVVRECAPAVACPERDAIVLAHGDFSGFRENFLPRSGGGLAAHLAAQGIDVWGLDRPWARLPLETSDFSSLAGQGLGAAAADMRAALAVIRAARGLGGAGFAPVPIGGFSRGGLVVLELAAVESRLPRNRRHASAVLDLDVYYRTDDADMRAQACARHADQQAQLASGLVAADNTVFPLIAALAVDDPDGDSPILPGASNRDAFLTVAGATYLLFTVTPWYHLAAPGYSDETAILGWFSDARPWQSLQEIDDGDALWCGLTPPGVVGELSEVRIPLLYVGAAGGFGALGTFTTSLVGGEVETLFVSDRPAGEELLDVGHADLLFAQRALPVWDAIATWLRGR